MSNFKDKVFSVFTQKTLINEGQSLFEIIFVIAITALILTGVVSLSAVSVRNTGTASNQGMSSRYLREAIDFLRLQRDAGWTSFSSRASETGTTWCLGDLEWPASPGACSSTDFIAGTNNMIREAALSFPDASTTNTVNVVLTVSWSDSQGTHSETVNTAFVDWNDTDALHE